MGRSRVFGTSVLRSSTSSLTTSSHEHDPGVSYIRHSCPRVSFQTNYLSEFFKQRVDELNTMSQHLRNLLQAIGFNWLSTKAGKTARRNVTETASDKMAFTSCVVGRAAQGRPVLREYQPARARKWCEKHADREDASSYRRRQRRLRNSPPLASSCEFALPFTIFRNVHDIFGRWTGRSTTSKSCSGTIRSCAYSLVCMVVMHVWSCRRSRVRLTTWMKLCTTPPRSPSSATGSSWLAAGKTQHLSPHPVVVSRLTCNADVRPALNGLSDLQETLRSSLRPGCNHNGRERPLLRLLAT